MNKFIFFLCFTLSASLESQTAIDVAELTQKISGLEDKTLMYGFAEGDQIIFNFTELDGKELKEMEIVEYPSNSKYMDYKISKVENKAISVTKKGVYTFRFSNSGLLGRVCKIKIQRIPASDALKNFNTNVQLKTFYDTTWIAKSKIVLDRIDTVAEIILDKQGEIVHVAANEHGAYSKVEVILPKYTSHWAYWIGVGEGAQKSFTSSQEKMAQKSLKYLGMADPLAALAVGGISYLISETAVDNVAYKLTHYRVVDGVKQELIFHNGGDIVKPDYGVMYPPKAPKEGYMYFDLYNDNYIDPLYVFIKVLAVKHIPVEKTVHYKEANVTSYQKPVMIE